MHFKFTISKNSRSTMMLGRTRSAEVTYCSVYQPKIIRSRDWKIGSVDDSRFCSGGYPVLKNSGCRLLKKIRRRGRILVIVSVTTWSRIPNQHEHVPRTRIHSSEAIERQRSIWIFFSSLLVVTDNDAVFGPRQCENPLALVVKPGRRSNDSQREWIGR